MDLAVPGYAFGRRERRLLLHRFRRRERARAGVLEAVAFDNFTSQDFNATTWAVTKPAHVADGELVFVILNIDGSGTVNTVPTGWALIGTAQAASTDSELRVYWKVAASEGASWSWVWAATETGTAEVVTYTGAHATTPIDSSAQGSASGTTIAAGALTAGVNDCMYMAVYGSDPVAGQSMTDDASPDGTERIDDINGTDSWIGMQDFLQGTAAAVTLEAVMTNSDTYSWFLVAIKPAAGGQTVALNRATETNTARAFGRLKTKALGRASETDTARPITRSGQRIPLSRASETNTARPLAWAPKNRLLNRAAETNTARALTAFLSSGGASVLISLRRRRGQAGQP